MKLARNISTIVEKKKALILLQQTDPYDNLKKTCILRKTRNGLWGIIGGGIEESEDPITAAKRELVEETQLNSKNIKLDPKYRNITAKYNYGSPTRSVCLFKATYLTPLLPINISVIDDPKYPQPEHFEFRWVAHKQEIKNLPFGSDSIKTEVMKLLI